MGHRARTEKRSNGGIGNRCGGSGRAPVSPGIQAQVPTSPTGSSNRGGNRWRSLDRHIGSECRRTIERSDRNARKESFFHVIAPTESAKPVSLTRKITISDSRI